MKDTVTLEISPKQGDEEHAPLKRVGKSVRDPESPDPRTRMGGEIGTPQIKRSGNHAGRRH